MTSMTYEFPLSVEEAGALLGATITRCGKETFPLITPPKGMHSSFATTLPVPSSEILNRLYDLRALLRSTPSNEPVTAAPSLLAVLMKVIGVSTSLAAAAAPSNPAVRRLETPPLFSTPLRKLWVDCVVLCHVRGIELTGTAKIDTTQFIRRMLALATTNPRSAKAAGGVRIAALQVVEALLCDETSPKIASQLAPWTLEIFQVSLKALRSAGNGEPTYRIAAVRMACAATMACRHASLKTRGLQGNERLVIQGGMEDKAIHEAIKILKQAVTDKFPEVRSAATAFAAALPPFLFLASGGADVALTTSCLDEVMHLAMKNLDDEAPLVSDGWADVLARCICTALQYHQQNKAATSSDKRDEATEGDGRATTTPDAGNRYASRKNVGLSASFTNVKTCMGYLVDQFIKVGGELAAVRAGGTFSIGGRAVRMGYTLAITKFVGLQYEMGSIGDGRLLSIRDLMISVLEMVGPEVEKQVQDPSISEGSSGSVTPLFGSPRTWSRCDSMLVRISASRVIRRGLVELAPEPVQISVLQTIVDILGTSASGEHGIVPLQLNSCQTQVVVIEISHILTALRDAAQSKIGEIAECLKSRLSHEELAVRHEAAVALASLTNVFPSEGRKLAWDLLDEFQKQHAQLVTVASTRENGPEGTPGGRFFRRSTKAAAVDPTIPHQSAIHGIALTVSLIIKMLPGLPGGLPAKLLSAALAAAEVLMSCRQNEVLCFSSPASVCFCVRAGCNIISGILAAGIDGIDAHIPLVFKSCQTVCNLAKEGSKGVAPVHDVFCIDSVLSAIVVFLTYNSVLLLSVPDALTQITLMLEGALTLFATDGRFATIEQSTRVTVALDSAKASLLEAFAWLPSGTFPIAADEVSRLAASQIREAIDSDITCSILPSMVNREDHILDAKTFSRARLGGQVGGFLDLEETLITLNADVALHGDRESISLLLEHDLGGKQDNHNSTFRGSQILGRALNAAHSHKPPTPLHEVGTWRRPLDPSCAGKVRLTDAAIQAFAATFGLKSGHEQQEAMDMLESLVPPLLMQLARSLGMTPALTDHNFRSKAKEDSSAVENIMAVILSCLQALPLHDSTHNISIRLCPPWMNKAKDLLLALLPSPSTVVRRAAAEGLALLATVGVSEDGHFLQSAVLHSLDEVMQGNKPDGKPRSLSLDSVSAARAGSLLTLAFIQRTNYTVIKRKQQRAVSRVSNESSEVSKTESNLPVFQMMTRILPSVASHGRRDYFTVRTCALHAFAILVTYSGRLDKHTVDSMQLLRKGVELIEENFVSSWTASSTDYDRGQEGERMTSEVSFLVVLLRFMTCYVPYIENLKAEDPNIARRFCVIATLVLELQGSHPAVFAEAMAFFEVMASNTHLLPSPAMHVLYSENPLFSCIPRILETLVPHRYGVLAPHGGYLTSSCAMPRAAIYAAMALSVRNISLVRWTDMKIVSLLFAAMDFACSSHRYPLAETTRSLATCREVEEYFSWKESFELEILSTVKAMFSSERVLTSYQPVFHLRWILLCRAVLAGGSSKSIPDNNDGYTRLSIVNSANKQASDDFAVVSNCVSAVRWQVKLLASSLVLEVTRDFIQVCSKSEPNYQQNAHFDFRAAEDQCRLECQDAKKAERSVPSSKLVFHLEELIASACMNCVATADHAELFPIQEVSIRWLNELTKPFHTVHDPDEPDSRILEQYLTQIFSAVKHALSAHEESQTSGARRLFIAGCEVLETMLSKQVTTDPLVIKRLLRPTMMLNVPRFGYFDSYPKDVVKAAVEKEHSETQSALLPIIGKLWLSGMILTKHTHPSFRKVSDELIKDKVGLAIHSAAAAIDGARLLTEAKVSLVGLPVAPSDDIGEVSGFGFFLFKRADSIDDSVKKSLVQHWPSLARNSLTHLLAELSSSESNAETNVICLSWLRVLIPLIMQGSFDAMAALESNIQGEGLDTTELSTTSLHLRDTLVNCLGSLSLIVDANNSTADCCEIVRLDDIVDRLRDTIITSFLETVTQTNNKYQKQVLDEEVMGATSKLLLILCSSTSEIMTTDAPLVASILIPLKYVQDGLLSWEQSLIGDLVISSFKCATALIRTGRANDTFVKTLLHFVLNELSQLRSNSELVANAASDLVRACMDCHFISLPQRSALAESFAANENWEPWEVSASVESGSVVAASLKTVKEKLKDFANPPSQLAAVTALRNALLDPLVKNDVKGLLFNELGGSVAGIFNEYGSHGGLDVDDTVRSDLFAASMKILLIAYQTLSDDGDEAMSTFLALFFQAQLGALRCNGLPNHPTATPGGNPILGRMCAQSILHIAKTTPHPFKETISRFAEHDRALLEFSVRAEMNGYTTASSHVQPEEKKKKLSIKGFKK
ncbi:hypothetical protein FisN_4Lh537 [Fistulifera solaris]|uniref:HEAT repeat-containing protein 5B n=1 Tax=Fistulifera solaris TaxID=1519565 RepID=A0A1Z5KE67_FISSO|nr:hypothetical protein FisN_4Lh537 [Fistulifera solaris]|eukprot:GAX24402.1 hypothetical protein FisN_4Lh537 [Fistulifera solaris]